MEIGLYFHIPFCASKCFYCDFLSFPKQDQQEQYIDALIMEMAKTSESLTPDTKVSTIFIGGGTPTVLPPVLIDKFLSGIMQYFTLTKSCEWTIEANPGTIDEDKIKVMKKYPITRISMGLQTTHDSLLKAIGRGHRFKHWEESMALVKTHTSWQVNADLMFALPNQSFEQFAETLDTVMTYDLDHFSIYALIIEEGTHFGDLYEKGELQEVDETLDRKMYHYAQRYLKEHGYEQYEISNWAKNGRICKHNMVYWQLKPYIGLGLGAHSLYNNKRFYNEQDITAYIAAKGDLEKLHYNEENMTKQMAMEEYMFLGLRLIKGIDESAFEKQFGIPLETVYGKHIDHWTKKGLLKREAGRLFLTDYGLDVCNEVFSSFLEHEDF